MKVFIPILFSALSFAQGQTNSIVNSFEYTRDIYKKVNSIGSIEPKSFNRDIEGIRKEIEKFIEHKKGVCQGDFSTIILNEESGEKSDYKLTKSEQELCYRELKALQISYINELFKARTNYLNYLHTERIKKLSDVREDALKQIQATFDKKVVRKKSFGRKNIRKKSQKK